MSLFDFHASRTGLLLIIILLFSSTLKCLFSCVKNAISKMKVVVDISVKNSQFFEIQKTAEELRRSLTVAKRKTSCNVQKTWLGGFLYQATALLKNILAYIVGVDVIFYFCVIFGFC